MIDLLIPKIRALIVDISIKGFETFVYRNIGTFTIAEENIISITKVFLNGNELGTGEYSFDSVTNKITIVATGLANGDIIEVDYRYYKYSDDEIKEYIRASLVWISQYAVSESDFELEGDDIYPTPDNKIMDLIALITSVLIKPDYTTYKLPTITVVYSGRLPKDQKIQKLLAKYTYGLGHSGVLEVD